jgi:hypothetical protein
MLPTKFRFIWPSSFREDFKKSANQKQELPMVAMFVDGSGENGLRRGENEFSQGCTIL